MKNFFKKAVCVIFAVFMLLPANICAMASDEYAPETIEAQNEDMARISGLIATYYIAIEGSGTNLKMGAKIVCKTEVVKSGFKEIVIQRRKSSTDSWSNYLTYKDLYADGSSYTYAKTVTITSGYQYRATCKFYAKKNILSTQTLSATSNTVYI